MTDPKLAHATNFGRMYSRSVDSEPEVPSITNVMSYEAVNLEKWHGKMAAQDILENPRILEILGHEGKMKYAATKASEASDRYRQEAAARGDRVHDYAENLALRTLGRKHNLDQAYKQLCDHAEQNFATSLERWWSDYNVEPIEPEITVWNQDIGYAGTIDLIAKIGGRKCVIDYKTKNNDWKGHVRLPDEKVVMQLVAAVKATEILDDADRGIWKDWNLYAEDPMLLAVAVGSNGTKTVQANPSVLQPQWKRFATLKKLWEHKRVLSAQEALLTIPPPVHSAVAENM